MSRMVVGSVAVFGIAAAAFVVSIRQPPLMWDLKVPLGRASDTGSGPSIIPMTCIVGYHGDPADANAQGALIDYRRATGGPTDQFGPDLWHSLKADDFTSLLALRDDRPGPDETIRAAVRAMWEDYGCRVDNRSRSHDDL